MHGALTGQGAITGSTIHMELQLLYVASVESM